jgi:hypothetical protein
MNVARTQKRGVAKDGVGVGNGGGLLMVRKVMVDLLDHRSITNTT